MREQVVLGGERFLASLRERIQGDAQEQRGARRLLAQRPELAAVIAAVEAVKGEKWEAFRERHADRGRDLVLYLGRRLCGMKLAALAETAGLKNYAVAATNARRYERCLERDKAEASKVRKVLKLLHCKTSLAGDAIEQPGGRGRDDDAVG